MGIYDSYNDTPNRIKTEGQTISLTFQENFPGVGQGTVTWNIPDSGTDNSPVGTVPAGFGAYAGFLILLSEWPLTTQNLPVNNRIYTPDPTANRQIHAGDKIGNALVIGAFYEATKIANSQTLTTTFIINDLKPNTAYYIGGFATDAQFRYHTEGVRAYSDKFAGPRGESVPARQFIKLGTPGSQHSSRILPSAGTGLIPGVRYQFDLSLDHTYPYKHKQKTFRINVEGSNSGTYCDLVTELNKQFSLMYCPPVSPVSPGTNELYWNSTTNTLFQLTYNPTTNVLTLTPILGVIVQGTDPVLVNTGSYWYDTTNSILYIRLSNGSWSVVPIINFGTVNPLALTCNDYWYDTTSNQGYVWSGTTWCEVNTIASVLDPSCPPTNLCGSFWYDTTNSTLYNWDSNTNVWDQTIAITWPIAPNNLATNTYWFDLTTTDTTPLHKWTGSAWTPLSNCVISTTQPNIAPLSYWYNPTTEILQQYTNSPSPLWTTFSVLVWLGDPTIVTSCDLWWNSNSNVLSQWSVVTSTWVPVANFYDQAIDPSLPPILPVGTLWYNSTTGVTQRWDGVNWIPINVATSAANPLTPTTGSAWLNPANNTWYTYTGSTWVSISPIISATDPTSLPIGTYWYNTTSNTLSSWNGIAWVVVSFSTTPPFPTNNQFWFNSTTNTLYVWESLNSVWRQVPPPVHASLDHRNYLVFTTSQKGSNMHVKVLVPGPNQVITSGHASFQEEGVIQSGIYDLDASLGDPLYDEHQRTGYPPSNISDSAFLFNNLVQGATIGEDVAGADAVSDVPSYMEIGIGADGTPDERRALADVIRRQLGYPAVQVELDKQQIDDCITFALTQFRQKSSAAYKRGFFFLDVHPHKQKYILSNRQLGYHKIVGITAVQRFTSAFLATANGAGAYGQIVLQHLYNMGTYDLTSFYLVSNYIETLELMFSTRITFAFNEASRMLHMYNSFNINERVLMDCTVELTEQEIMKNRISINWIREWALSECMLMLSQIRGKYSTLPSANGSVTLNASELRDRAEKLQDKLQLELDDYLAQDLESFGAYSGFTMG